MNDDEWEDFKSWFEMQPSTVKYTECRSFISSYLNVNKGKAEVEMANLDEDGKIKVIRTYKASGTPRRVFLKPLDPLTEADIRSVFDGQWTEVNLEDVAKSVHDQTGHDVQDIADFIVSLSSAEVTGSTFRWANEEGDDI